MKTTLTVTSRGVVTLPAKLRKALGIQADDQLIAETTPEGLLLRPAVTLAVEIYSENRIREAVGLDGVRYFVVACPKDVTMYEDAVKTTGQEGRLVVRDLIEVVEEALA